MLPQDKAIVGRVTPALQSPSANGRVKTRPYSIGCVTEATDEQCSSLRSGADETPDTRDVVGAVPYIRVRAHTIHHPPSTIRHSLFTIHHSLFTIHHSSLSLIRYPDDRWSSLRCHSELREESYDPSVQIPVIDFALTVDVTADRDDRAVLLQPDRMIESGGYSDYISPVCDAASVVFTGTYSQYRTVLL